MGLCRPPPPPSDSSPQRSPQLPSAVAAAPLAGASLRHLFSFPADGLKAAFLGKCRRASSLWAPLMANAPCLFFSGFLSSHFPGRPSPLPKIWLGSLLRRGRQQSLAWVPRPSPPTAICLCVGAWGGEETQSEQNVELPPTFPPPEEALLLCCLDAGIQ